MRKSFHFLSRPPPHPEAERKFFSIFRLKAVHRIPRPEKKASGTAENTMKGKVRA